METALDIREILTFLPHRHPFVLVDRILSVVPGKKVVGLKNVTYNEPFFAGHFPENPVMPGVLILEALGQAGGILAYMSAPERKPGELIYFTGMDKVRFRHPVVPGDSLKLEITLARQRKNAIKMQGRALVESRLAAEAEFMAIWGEKR